MRKSSSYGLLGYREFTGRGTQDKHDNNRYLMAFDLFRHDRMLKKMAATGVDLRVVVWVNEFLLGRSQRVRVDGKVYEEVRVTSGVPQGNVLVPLIFLAYVNDIWRNIESNILLFADGGKYTRE